MNFQEIPFRWDQPEAEEACDIRFTVFVDEQKVPREEELDHIDPVARHVLLRTADGKAIATGRVFEAEPGTARIGRVAVLHEYRGTGAGKAVMFALMREALRAGFERVDLDSQVHAIPFYEKCGFRLTDDPEFLECDMPHRKMVVEADLLQRVLADK